MQMQQESHAVRCGNSSPQEGMVCGGGFRLFKLAGLIWPLSMDRLLSPSLPSNPLLFFFRSLAKMRAGIHGLDLCRNRRRLLSADPLLPSHADCPNCSRGCWMCACVKLETQTSVHANLTRPSVRHSTPGPTKKEVRVCQPPLFILANPCPIR